MNLINIFTGDTAHFNGNAIVGKLLIHSFILSNNAFVFAVEVDVEEVANEKYKLYAINIPMEDVIILLNISATRFLSS